MDGRDDVYAQSYAEDAQAVQMRRQHHVHVMGDDGERKPLTHCRRKDDPTKCKANFPRTGELCLTQPAVICRGLASKCGLPAKGARNVLGCIKGRRNDEWLNGTHPAMSVALRCNSDVQLPYRLPITEESHADTLCSCLAQHGVDDADMVFGAQVAQDSQVGYCCDYANKRGPIAVNETKEMMKGQSDMGAALRDAEPPHSLSYIWGRHKKRILSDCYGRGVVRGAVEAASLLTQSRTNNATFLARAARVRVASSELGG